MDLGLADATAVVTGGSKGMGRAVAEVLAADGARVAVMARGRAALDETVEALLAAGAPEAFGISVDMTDAQSIEDGFAEVAQRWPALNILVHTIGPGRRPLRGARRRRLGRGVHPRHHVVRAQRPGRAALHPGRRMGPHLHLLGPLGATPEPAHRRLHGGQVGRLEHFEEPGQVAGPRGHPGQHHLSRAPS